MKKLKILFIYANSMMDNLIPVGTSAILGAIKRADPGIEIKLFDTTFYKTDDQAPDTDRAGNLQVLPVDYTSAGISFKKTDIYDDFKNLVSSFNPDILMLSVVEATYAQGISLLESINQNKTRPYTIAGGVFAILSAETVITCDCIDAVCVGEGEDALVDFCDKFAKGADFTDINGIWFKQKGGIIKNPVRSLVNLNAAAFLDFSLYEKGRFYKPMQGRIFKMVPLEFSRGCPYRCSYCANHALERLFKPAGRWYRWKSMDRIFAEIDDYLNKYGVEFFYFVSETFLSMPEEKFDEFCERYAGYKIPFWFNTRPETITKRRLKKLEEINCFRMGIGLEHGNEKFRQTMLNRRVSNEKIVEACKMVEDSKIAYSINNIIGFPGETRELVFDTINLNRRISPDTVGTFVFTPFKGTDLYDYCLKHDHIDPSAKTGNLNRGSILKNNTLGDKEIRGLLRTFPLYVHFDTDMFDSIKKAESFTEEGNAMFRQLSQRYTQEHFKQKKR